MMQVYYMRVSWVSGIAFFASFVLTFWPSRSRLLTAAALWVIGTITFAGLSAYDMLMRGGTAFAFSPPSSDFPLFAWLIPLLSLVLAITESVFLFPWIAQERALRIGKILFLAVVPVYLIFVSLANMRMPFYLFPIGISWLGYPLLWFRIRESLK